MVRRPHVNRREPRGPGPTAQQLVAEFIGTGFLLAGVVGSGIMAERLTEDPGLRLLQNAFATACLLVALIFALASASGAHFNPAVTLASRAFGVIATPQAVAYVVVQLLGGSAGVGVANLMFGEPVVALASTDRTGGDLFLSEVVATAGLIVVIFGVVRSQKESAVAVTVGAYIGAAYYFTSSTSFANPAVTVARSLSDTFTGIDPASIPAFVVAQLLGTGLAVVAVRVIYPADPASTVA